MECLGGVPVEELERRADRLLHRKPSEPSEPGVISLEDHSQEIDQQAYRVYVRLSGDPDLVEAEQRADKAEVLRPLQENFRANSSRLTKTERSVILLRGSLTGDILRIFPEIAGIIGVKLETTRRTYYRAMHKLSL